MEFIRVLFRSPHAPVAVARHVTFEGDIVPDDGRFDGDQTIARRYFPVMLQPTRHLRVRLVPEIEINGMACKSARRQAAGVITPEVIQKIGKPSVRDRVCKYVWISGVTVE